MQHLYRLYALLLFCLVSTFANAQWQRMKGPVPDFYGPAGTVTCIATNDTVVWIGTANSGIFRASNQPFSPWEATNNGVNTFTIYSLSYHNGLLVATTLRGVYKSTDKGNSWTAINSGLPIEKPITSFASANGVLMAATSSYGVFRSTDNGQSWGKANNGMLDNNVLDLETDGTRFWALTYNAGLFKSDDGGQSWQNVSVAGSCSQCAQLEIIDSTLFLAGGSIWVSRNNGNNWTVDTTVKNITGITAHNGMLIAYNTYRLYESFDTGRTWMLDWEFNTDSAMTVNAALSTPAAIKFAGTQKHGLLRGSIAAITWKPMNNELLTGTITNLEEQNGYVYTTAFGKLFRTEKTADNWTEVGNVGWPVINSFTTYPDKLIVGTDTGGVYVAGNNLLWEPSNNGLGNKNILRLLKIGNQLFALTKGGIYRSPNRGQVWVKYADNIIPYDYTDLYFDNGIVYAGTTGGIYSSDNDGFSFTIVNPANIPRREVFFIRRVNGTLWLKIGIDTHISEDGLVWPRHYYLGGVTFANSLSLTQNRMYASTTSGFMFRDTASMQWNYIKNIEGLVVNVFHQSDSFLFAGSGAGVWRLPIESVVTGIQANKTNTLAVYPNPAKEAITIGTGEVYNRIIVFNAEGRKVLSTQNTNELVLQALPAGLYIIQAVDNKGSYTQKFIKE